MRLRLLVPAIALFALAACMSPPPPQPGVSTAPLGGITTLSVDAAETAVANRLTELGFTVQQSRETGVLQGEIVSGAASTWAACDRMLVTERDDRTRTHWADADDLRARVTVRFSALGGQTSVAMTPRFDGIYLDRFDNLPFERSCASMGVVETQILAALAG